MAEVLSAVALALACGAFVLAAFAWVRSGGRGLGRATPARAAGSSPAVATEAPPAPRPLPNPPYSTDPLVLLRLDALERRVVEAAAAVGPAESGDAAARSAGAEASAPPEAPARVAGWRAFP